MKACEACKEYEAFRIMILIKGQQKPLETHLMDDAGTDNIQISWKQQYYAEEENTEYGKLKFPFINQH